MLSATKGSLGMLESQISGACAFILPLCRRWVLIIKYKADRTAKIIFIAQYFG